MSYISLKNYTTHPLKNYLILTKNLFLKNYTPFKTSNINNKNKSSFKHFLENHLKFSQRLFMVLEFDFKPKCNYVAQGWKLYYPQD